MSKKILIVDDEPDMRTFLSALLEENGYDATLAENGKMAAKNLKEETPDLVLLDLMMPEKSGISFYRELRKNSETAKVPVIMVTAFENEKYPDVDFSKQIYDESVPAPQAYLKKPVDKDLLVETIKKLI